MGKLQKCSLRGVTPSHKHRKKDWRLTQKTNKEDTSCDFRKKRPPEEALERESFSIASPP